MGAPGAGPRPSAAPAPRRSSKRRSRRRLLCSLLCLGEPAPAGEGCFMPGGHLAAIPEVGRARVCLCLGIRSRPVDGIQDMTISLHTG